jgi:MFS family permease
MQSLLFSLNRVAVIGLVYSSARMLIGATSAVYLLSKGISASEVGVMKSFQALLLMLLEFPLGVLADRKGRRICLILGGLAGAAWLSLTAASSSLWMLLLAEGFNALSMASFNGAFDALLAERYIAERGRPLLNKLLGDYHAVLFSLMALFSLVGGTFVSPTSSLFWWIASAIILLGTGFVPLLIHSDKPIKAPGSVHENTIRSSGLFKLLKGEFAVVFSIILTRSELRKVALPFIVVSVFYQLLIPYWQLFFSGSETNQFPLFGFDLTFFGPVFFSILMVQSLASKTLSSRKFTNLSERMLQLGLAVCAALLAAAVYWRGSLILSVVALLAVFALVRFYTLRASAHIHNLVDDSRRASVLSALSVSTRVALVVILPASGYMIGMIGVWILPLLGALLGGILVLSEALSHGPLRLLRQCSTAEAGEGQASSG